jgi:dipeptide/tripeptide permease
MELHGLPNDILPNIDPITIIILIPLLDRLIYPFIRSKLRIAFKPITRITWGFVVASLAMAYAAFLQSRIYASEPCYDQPSHCPAGLIPGSTDRYKPNKIHVALQTPAYILVALSEIFASVTGLELAYAKAPENMKSFIMSLFLLTSAVGSALGILVAPSAKDPHLVWLYSGLACTAAAAGGAFYWMFKGQDDVKPRPIESAVEEGEIEMAAWASDEEDDRAREV